jgi:hypothetical protein
MDGECCVQKAARLVGKIVVKGQAVGIAQLPRVLEEAHTSGLEGEALVQELVRLAAIYNYIPSGIRVEYGQGLLEALESYRAGIPELVGIDGGPADDRMRPTH